MAENLINGSADFAAFNMGAANVIGGGHKRTGERLNPVPVDHHKVGFVFGNVIGKSGDSFGQHMILWIARTLVDKFVDGHTLRTRNFMLGQTVTIQHMHTRHPKPHVMPPIPRRNGKRFKFAEIRAGSGDKKD